MLLRELEAQGVTLTANGGELGFRGPKSALSEPVRERLRACKADLLTLLARRGGVPHESPADTVALCSAGQRRLWFLAQLETASTAYNMCGAYRCRGDLDARAFGETMAFLVRRHESLRTVFALGEGQVTQRVRGDGAPFFEALDFRASRDPEAEARRLLEAEQRWSFDLAAGPLLRARLMRVGDTEWIFSLCLHHIVADGWSVAVLARDAFVAYGALAAGRTPDLPPLPIQYRHFAAWKRAQLARGSLAESRAYWQRQLAEPLPVLDLAADRARPVEKRFRGATHELRLGATTVGELQRIAREENATLFMVLVAAVKVLLFRHSGQLDLIVGTPIAGRTQPELRDQVGFYVETLALRDLLDPDDTFRQFVAKVRQTTLDAYRHQDYPFDAIVTDLGLTPDRSRNPVFDVMVVMNESWGTPKLAGLDVTPVEVASTTSKFDLTFTFEPLEGGARAAIQYDVDLFAPDRIARLARHLEVLLAAAIGDRAAPIKRLQILPEEERRELLRTFNDTAATYSATETIVSLFAEQARRYPDRVAVQSEDRQLTYAQLDARTDQLVARLRGLGTKAEEPIAVALGRSSRTIVAVLGVLKAGGAYVPVDPNYPSERIAYILQNCGARILVTDATTRLDLNASGVTILDIDAAHSIIATDTDPIARPEPNHLAYIIYTSGSTGRPKGVMIEHRHVANLVRALGWYKPGMRVGLVAPFVFDGSVKQIFGSLLTGGTLVIASEEVRRDPRLLQRFFDAEALDVCDLTPAHLAALASVGASGVLPRTLLVGGDKLTLEAVDAALGQNGCERIVNVYGPTECCVDATQYVVEDTAGEASGLLPIGRPLANVRTYVLDAFGELAPIGCRGELCIGGAQVGRGYRGDERLTAEKFVLHPALPGERIYRTGDTAYWRKDGTLVCVGRIDRQVKVRGYRIELGEIEAAMAGNRGVKQAVVVVRPYNGQPDLCAYFTGDATVANVQQALRTQLPDYMVPAHWTRLASMPLTVNGKIDFAALPVPDVDDAPRAYVPPETALERELAQVWQDILGRTSIGLNDNFFALGGHSLRAVQLIVAIESKWQVRLSLAEIFKAPTLRMFATTLAGKRPTPTDVIPRTSVQDTYPLSSAQRRLWLLCQFPENSVAYNISGAFALEGSLDLPAFRQAFARLIERHESLRTTFVVIGGEPRQRIAPSAAFLLDEEDAGTFAPPDARARELALAAGAQPFDLARGPLLRGKLIRTAPARWLFAFTMHHIVSDAASIRVLMHEVLALYEATRAAAADPLPALSIQYRDYAVWQNAREQGEATNESRAYWATKLGGELPALDLPADRPRPAQKTYRGAVCRTSLRREHLRRLDRLAHEQSATLFMVLSAAVRVLLYRYTGQADAVLGTPVAGRDHGQLRDQIGFYVGTLALRDRLEPSAPFTTLVGQVRQTVLDAYNHQHYSFDRIVEELQVPWDASRHPLFEIMVAMVEPRPQPVVTDLRVVALPLDQPTSKFDLLFEFADRGDRLSVDLTYNTDLFDAERIERMAQHFAAAVEALAANPMLAPRDVDILPAAERERVMRLGCGLARGERLRPGGDRPVVHQFEAQVRRTPEAVAVSCGDTQLTYRELDRRANRVAWHLRRHFGVGREPIGIFAEPTVDTVVGLFGILKAGAAYAPIDPNYPLERVCNMVGDAKARLVLGGAPDCMTIGDVRVVPWAAFCTEPTDELPPVAVASDDTIYVIFTSGSTGRPKGSGVYHRGFSNLMAWYLAEIEATAESRTTLLTSLSFDLTQKNIYAPLMVGGELCLSGSANFDPRDAVRLIEERQLAWVNCTPSMFHALLEYCRGDDYRPLRSLRHAVLGGEPIPTDELKAWYASRHCHGTVVNSYGPTECADVAVAHRVERAELETRATALTGRPIGNVRTYVVSERLQLQPIGVPGELCIGGVGVGSGYGGDAALTAAKFIASPFHEGETLYRTGDLFVLHDDGALEFRGRNDHQVKIRGYRVELGEVEAALRDATAAREVVVLVRQAHGGETLCAYLGGADALDLAAVKQVLRRRLPDYMVPTAFVSLPNLPLNPNGKIDRHALPAPELPVRTVVLPRTPAETRLVAIWHEVLAQPTLSVDDRFFDVGGNSLLAMKVAVRIKAAFGQELEVRELFANPTIADLALRLDAGTAGVPSSASYALAEEGAV